MRSNGTITPLLGHQRQGDGGEGTRTHHPLVNTPPHPPAIPLRRSSTTETFRTQGKKERRERKRKMKRRERREQKQQGLGYQKAGIFFPCPRVDRSPDLAPRLAMVVGAASVPGAEQSHGIGSRRGHRSGTGRVSRGGRGAGGPACRVRGRL